jgi:hypothetical protein
LLWAASFHDAPLSGLAEVNGKWMWFDTPWDEDADDWPVPPDRECLLHELTDKELTEVWRRHDLFEKWVSTRYCYHLSDSERVVRDQSIHEFFYDAEGISPFPDCANRPSVGSFRLYDVWWPPPVGGDLDSAR